MAIFKCKMCGGTIEFEQGATVGVCDSCGTKQTLPRIDDDRRANLYDRASHYRRNNDFDKAAGIYEQILNEDNADAEAYWSLVLCRYGIEYVEDPKTHRRIPTVNRAQFTSIYMDVDYKSALQYADGYQRQIYEEEARVIDDIQKVILEISSKEEPFDIFICYKETDANGRRTQDSVLANDLYHELVEEGFKVFFSRITLEDKLGTAYEPYIFAALNSAKVMVVLGTRPEYFNAVWVRNEWSRYLSLVKQSNGKKMLIPAYRDMDPYDLPEEFSHLQAQDMSKLGFMQDLIRGIKKIIGATTPRQTIQNIDVVNNASSANESPLLERAFLFLEDGKWQDANIYCEKVLDLNPRSAEAYLGKLMADLRVRTRERLADCKEPFDDNENYSKVIRFSDEQLESEMRGYIAHINERNENERALGIYNSSVEAMNSATTEADLKTIALAFRNISAFRDADTLAEQCLERAEESRKENIYTHGKEQMARADISNYSDAINTFTAILGYRDADEQIDICRKRIEDLRAKEEAYYLNEARKAKERLKILKKVAVCACIVVVILREITKISLYDDAIRLYNAGDIVEAYEKFISLDGYRDSNEQANFIYDKYVGLRIKVATVGDTVYFGEYEQDNIDEKQPICWRILAKEGSRALLISEKALDCMQYNISDEDITYDKSSLHSWLNETFLNAAFSKQEQLQIVGIRTKYKIFLLSINEVNEYFNGTSVAKCIPTAYAIANGAETSISENKVGVSTCWWWLRSPGSQHSLQYTAARVNFDGKVDDYGNRVSDAGGCVRPAMWVTLDP